MFKYSSNDRTVAQRKPVVKHVASDVAQQVGGEWFINDVTRKEFDALKAEVAALRGLIARQAVAPAAKSRAEYYREYRKRTKS